MYNDLGLFQRSVCFLFFVVVVFQMREVLEANDKFNYLQYFASTKSSSALVGGRSCTCVFHCTSLRCTLFFSSFFPPCVSFVVLRKIMTLNFILF